MRLLVLFSLLSAALITHRTATHHTTPAQEAPVLLTASYSLAAGTLTNVLCATGAYLAGAVPGMECEACVPWSVVAGLVAARMHTFAIGGWGAEGRGFVKEVPGRGARWLVGGPERWFETFDAVGEGEGFVRKVRVGDETETETEVVVEVEGEGEPGRAEL